MRKQQKVKNQSKRILEKREGKQKKEKKEKGRKRGGAVAAANKMQSIKYHNNN